MCVISYTRLRNFSSSTFLSSLLPLITVVETSHYVPSLVFWSSNLCVVVIALIVVTEFGGCCHCYICRIRRHDGRRFEMRS